MMMDLNLQPPPPPGGKKAARGVFSPRPRATPIPKRLSRDETEELKSSLLDDESSHANSSKAKAGKSPKNKNKLRFDNIGMVGRDWERNMLDQCFARLLISNNNTANSLDTSGRSTSGTRKLRYYNYKELIWIKGFTGAGVSSLAKTLERAVAQTPRGLLIEGKFDKKSSDEPFSGLLLALGQIFQKLVGGKMSMRRIMVRRRSGVSLEQSMVAPEEASRVSPAMQKVAAEVADALRTELGPELDLLSNMIPYLENLLMRGRASTIQSLEQAVKNAEKSMRNFTEQRERSGFDKSLQTLDSNLSNGTENTIQSHMQDGFQAGQKRLKYAFRILLRVLSSYFHPLVLVQDDLQWADAASLDVLDYLISDVKNTNAIMIVGCYRAIEGIKSKKVLKTIRNMSAKSSKHQFHVTNIDLAPFTVRDVNQVVMNLMQIPNAYVTQPLAEVVNKRTGGNPQFTIEFMKMLKEEGHLKYEESESRWVWDERMIEKLTKATDNVTDLLKRRMKKLAPDLQLMLPYAACWGSIFHRESLLLVVSEHSGKSLDVEMNKNMDALLSYLEENRYIEKIDVGTYTWVDDQVQEAAVSLIDASISTFQFEIGCILHDSLVKMHKTSEEVSIFNVADLINQGSVKRRPDFAELNYQAAEKAREISALHSAAKYVAHGLELLPNDKWTSHYRLTLKLYTLGVEVELAIGHVNTMQRYYQEVVSQEQCSNMDKLPLYITEFHRMSSVEFQFRDSVKFMKKCLKEFGCNLIWSRFLVKKQADFEFNRVRRMCRRLPSDFHEAKPLMTKPKHKAIMLLLSKLLYSCYAEDIKYILKICACKIVQMTIRHGVHDVSGFGFAVLGMLVNKSSLGWEEASAIAETGVALQERLQHGYSNASTIYTAHHFILPWTQPFESSIAPLYEGYVSGMRSGNVLFGTWCLVAQYIHLPYVLGLSLKRIIGRMPDCVHRLTEMKQDEQVLFLQIQWQMFLNLAGDDHETTVLEGQIFDPSMMHIFQCSETYFARLQLFIYYGEWRQAANLANLWGDLYQKTETGNPLCTIEAFHRGLANYAMARLTRRKAYEKEAVRARKLIGKWADAGCPNVAHFYALLNAEHAAFNLKDGLADTLYRDAIMMAENAGLIHDAALFYERFADFLQQDGEFFEDREQEASEHIDTAAKYYNEWGAKRKVYMLKGGSEVSMSA